MDPEAAAAKAEFESMDPEQRAVVQQLVAQGRRGRDAVATVRKMRKAVDVEQRAGEAEEEAGEPSIGKKAAALHMGAADALAPVGSAPAAMGTNRMLGGDSKLGRAGAAALQVGAPWLTPAATALGFAGDALGLDTDYAAGANQQRQASEEASSGKLGASYGLGRLAGDAFNAAGLASAGVQLSRTPEAFDPLMSKVNALRARLSGAGGRLKDAAGQMVRDTVAGQPATIHGNALRAAKAALGINDDAAAAAAPKDVLPVQVAAPEMGVGSSTATAGAPKMPAAPTASPVPAVEPQVASASPVPVLEQVQAKLAAPQRAAVDMDLKDAMMRQGAQSREQAGAMAGAVERKAADARTFGEMANQVANLPSSQRVAAIHAIAASQGKHVAAKVAALARVNMKLNPL